MNHAEDCASLTHDMECDCVVENGDMIEEIKIPIDALTFGNLLIVYSKDQENQRIGQYIINKLKQPITCPEVFYAQTPQECWAIFWKYFKVV